MASGDHLITFYPNMISYLDFGALGVDPTFTRRAGILLLSFQGTDAERCCFIGVMPKHYAGGDVKVTVHWCAATATSGNMVWFSAFKRFQDGTDDITAESGNDTQNTFSADAAPGTAGIISYASDTTPAADMDGIVAGESFLLAIARDPTNVGDTMAGAAQLICVSLEEL